MFLFQITNLSKKKVNALLHKEFIVNTKSAINLLGSFPVTGVTLTPPGVTIVGVTTLIPEAGVVVALAMVPAIF